MLEVGRITRPHGVRGDVNVLLTTNRAERLAKGAVLSTPDGPLKVLSSRPHKNGFIVRFAGLDDRTSAEDLSGTILSAEPIDDPEELWVHELVGAMVVDQDNNQRGCVTRLLENPASDLMELDSGALVPVQFVVSHIANETIRVDVPDGLFDLD